MYLCPFKSLEISFFALQAMGCVCLLEGNMPGWGALV